MLALKGRESLRKEQIEINKLFPKYLYDLRDKLVVASQYELHYYHC